MINLILNLHSECRKYCIKNIYMYDKNYKNCISELKTIYKSTTSNDIVDLVQFEKFLYKNFCEESTDNIGYELKQLTNTLFRKKILELMLVEIEKLLIKDFVSTNHLKKHIIQIINDSQLPKEDFSYYSRNFEIIESIYGCIKNEKDKFKNFIVCIDEERLRQVKVIYHRRILSTNEYCKIKELCYKKIEKNFNNKVVLRKEKLGLNLLKNILIKNKIYKTYEINTGNETGIETDISIFNPNKSINRGSDIYYLSDNIDWILFFDHEGFITIYGDWLIKELVL